MNESSYIGETPPELEGNTEGTQTYVRDTVETTRWTPMLHRR